MKDLKDKTIALASDHAGFDKKQVILNYFKEKGIKYHDFGCYTDEACDYPDLSASQLTNIRMCVRHCAGTPKLLL